MATGHPHSRALVPAIGSAVLACLFAWPAPAGDNVQVVPLASDSRGNQAWVEIESTGQRMKATPVVAVDETTIGKVLANPEEKGSLAIPVPRLMRLIERAREAIRDMKRPAAKAPTVPGVVAGAAAEPSGPVGKPGERPPGRTGSFAPPGKTDTGIRPPDHLYSTATR